MMNIFVENLIEGETFVKIVNVSFKNPIQGETFVKISWL